MRARVADKGRACFDFAEKGRKSQPDRIFFGKTLLAFINSGYERENYYRHVTVAQPRDYE